MVKRTGFSMYKVPPTVQFAIGEFLCPSGCISSHQRAVAFLFFYPLHNDPDPANPAALFAQF
jgi:hypothetical protein